MLRLINHDSIRQIVLLCALLTFIGIANVFIMPPLMSEFFNVVEAMERHRPGLFGSKGAYAQTYGIFNLGYAAGCIVGPLWAGFVQAKAGWGTMGWSLGILSAISAVPVAVYTGGLITRRHES